MNRKMMTFQKRIIFHL